MKRPLITLALASVVLLSIGVQTAEAQQSPAALALRTFLSALSGAYAICPMQNQLIGLKAHTAMLRGEEPDMQAMVKQMGACSDSAGRVIDSLYRRTAKAHLAPSAADQVKAIYADWKANTGDFLPRWEEIMTDDGRPYTQRMDRIEKEFTRKAERLKLDLE